MSSYMAHAIMVPTECSVRWADRPEEISALPLVAFIEELRRRASFQSGRESRALVRDMNGRAEYERGAVSALVVDPVGGFSAVAVERAEWERTAPPPPAHRPAAPLAHPTTGAPASSDLFSVPVATAGGSSTAPQLLPETIVATANTKGGAAKTTLAILLAAAAGELSGRTDVVLIDINPSGNLREHTHVAVPGTINDLARAAEHPMFGQATKDLTPYVNLQPGGWVTITSPTSIVHNDGGLITDLSRLEMGNAIRALTANYRMLIFDTGNNPKDEAWQVAVGKSDKIVVPLQWDPDTLVEAQKMVTDMRAVGHPELKRRIIFVGTYGPHQKPDRRRAREYRRALLESGWNVMDIPPDKHIAERGVIAWESLHKRTRRAALELAQAVLG